MTDEHAEPWPVTEAEYQAKLHAEAIARAVLTGIECSAHPTLGCFVCFDETQCQARAAVPEQPEPSPRG